MTIEKDLLFSRCEFSKSILLRRVVSWRKRDVFVKQRGSSPKLVGQISTNSKKLFLKSRFSCSSTTVAGRLVDAVANE